MKYFDDISDMIKEAEKTGKIMSSTASWLRGLCQYGSPAIAGAYLKKVQPYIVNEAKQRYELK